MKWNPFSLTGIALVIVLGIMCVPVSALTLRLDDAKFTSAGQTVTVDLIADEFPQGLSGYNISVTVKNPSVGLISAVIFPDWAVPRSSSAVPAASVWAKAVDMGNQVKPGDKNVVLAHIMVKGNVPGTTGFTIKPVAIDDEQGNAIVATVFVPPTTPVQTTGSPAPTTEPSEIETRGPETSGTPISITRDVTLSYPQGATPNPSPSGSGSPAEGTNLITPTPETVYANNTPEVVYVYVTRPTPLTLHLPIIGFAIVGIGMALQRRRGK
jgi:hypothetical protein